MPRAGLLGLIAGSLLLVAGCDGCFPTSGITGIWVGAGGEATERDAIIFNADGTFVIKQERSDITYPPSYNGGIPMEQEVPGTLRWRLDKQGTWELDDTKLPWWLDLIIQENGAPRRTENLVEISSPEVMRVGSMRGSPGRPASFEQSSLSLWRRPTAEESAAIQSQN